MISIKHVTIAMALTGTIALTQGLPQAYAYDTETIYQSTNLDGHQVFAECNPGGGTDCDCSDSDVVIESHAEYGEVTSNPFLNNTYVNAIGYKKFYEGLPNGEPLDLGQYIYRGQVRLTENPFPNPYQVDNAQAVHMMIQFYDGRDELYVSNKTSLEGVIYWELNPWVPDSGAIKIGTGTTHQDFYLKPSGIVVNPDQEWHQFELAVDLKTQTYLHVKIGEQQVDLTGLPMTKVHHPDWGNDMALSITTESMASWPQYTCILPFRWATRFRNLDFERVIQ
ncbi:MAG: hypothetical protein HQL52_14635 [Magnetococcales bacterium]|nr:hypothetical protein [Magnetococcales bacterium]